MIPRKDKFRGEYKLIPVAKKMKRFVISANGETDVVLNPPALEVMEDTTTTIDFPMWATLTCDEILAAIEKLKFTMTVIRVDEVTYNMYLNQIAIGEEIYTKKCTGGIKTPVDEMPTDVCPQGTQLAVVDGMKKCVPIGGGGDTGGGDTGGGTGGGGGVIIPPILTGGGIVGGGGGGAEEQKKMPYSWLWLVFMAAGVYVLTRKSE